MNGKGAAPGVELSATTEPPRTRRTESVTRPTALPPRVAASSTPLPSPIALTGMLALLLLGTVAAGIVVVRRR